MNIRTSSELWREYKARQRRNSRGRRLIIALVPLAIGVAVYAAIEALKR